MIIFGTITKLWIPVSTCETFFCHLLALFKVFSLVSSGDDIFKVIRRLSSRFPFSCTTLTFFRAIPSKLLAGPLKVSQTSLYWITSVGTILSVNIDSRSFSYYFRCLYDFFFWCDIWYGLGEACKIDHWKTMYLKSIPCTTIWLDVFKSYVSCKYWFFLYSCYFAIWFKRV